MVNTLQSKEGISVPALVNAEFISREVGVLTGILEDVSIRLHVLEYHLARLEAFEIVAGSGQTAAGQTYTLDEVSGMVSTYFNSPLQTMALRHMFKSGDPVQQQDAVQCVLAAKRKHDAQRAL